MIQNEARALALIKERFVGDSALYHIRQPGNRTFWGIADRMSSNSRGETRLKAKKDVSGVMMDGGDSTGFVKKVLMN